MSAATVFRQAVKIEVKESAVTEVAGD